MHQTIAAYQGQSRKSIGKGTHVDSRARNGTA
jgi:hypothetical protein